MKLKFLLLTLFIGVSYSYGQKSKIQAAYNYLIYGELDKAKQSIDEAAKGEGSSNIDKTWYYRGEIYEEIYGSEKYKSLAPDALDIAYQSYRKALEIDPNSEFKKEINARLNALRIDFHNDAVRAYQNKDYNSALKNFENELKITPEDSAANLYAAYSAERANNNAKAIEHYQKFISLKYDDAIVYRNLATIYKSEKDTAKALTTLQDGRKKFPDDLDLMLAEINIYLPLGKHKEAIDLLNLAISKDPKNSSLYFALGVTYDNLANPKDESGNSLTKPQDRSEFITKAADAYKKAIEIKPDYFEANYNLGALFFNQGAEMNAGISSIKDPKQYAAAKEQCEAIFRQSQPYLEKALELNPKDHDTLISLKQLYFRQNNTEKYNEMKAKLDAEGK